jgi:hypothetical protein
VRSGVKTGCEVGDGCGHDGRPAGGRRAGGAARDRLTRLRFVADGRHPCDGRPPPAGRPGRARLHAGGRGPRPLRGRPPRRPAGAAARDRLLLRQVRHLPRRGGPRGRHGPVLGRPPPRVRGAAARPGVLRPAPAGAGRAHRHAAHVPPRPRRRGPGVGRDPGRRRLRHGGFPLGDAARPGLHRRRPLRARRPGRLRGLGPLPTRWRPPRHPRRLQQPGAGRPGALPRPPAGAGLWAVPRGAGPGLAPRA